MRSVFLFALCTLALSCPLGQWDNAGVCTDCSSCTTGDYAYVPCGTNSDTICHACTTVVPCPSGQYWVPTACGPVDDNGCRDCSSVAPCPTGYYYDDYWCGHPDLHQYEMNGCQACTDCVTSTGPRFKAWGICGGPSPYTYNPIMPCLAPGVALCEVCSDYVPTWAWTQNPDLNISLCDNTLDDSWEFMSGKTETDLNTCCQDARDLQIAGDCEFAVNYVNAARYSCLYNSVMNCLGIYTPPGGWALPSAYPDEPIDDS